MADQLVTYDATNATYDGLQIYLVEPRNVTVTIAGPVVNVNFIGPTNTNVLVANLATLTDYTLATATVDMSFVSNAVTIGNMHHELTMTGPHGD